MGSILGFSPSIGKDDFDTPLPSNFTDEDIDTQDFAAIPRPMSEGTEAIIQLGKAMVGYSNDLRPEERCLTICCLADRHLR